jgi:hypothetical protein
MKPWELVPAFAEDRLVALGEVLLRIRGRAAALQEPDEGDTPWSLGCRVFARTSIQLARIAVSQELPWLVAELKQNSSFVKIGGVPIHIFRGDSTDPDVRQLQRGREKAKELLSRVVD